MSMVKQMIEPLDAISQQIWDDSLDDTAFDILRQKTLWLSAQIAVHQVLQNTSRHLLGPQNSSGLSNSQSRLGKFIDVLYGKPDNEKNEARWQKLRDMDCATFLFIAVSYTPLDITKMHRIEFDYLVDNASKFLHVKDLPPRWIFRKEIQIAIAGKADLEEAASFRRKYYALEFNPDILGKGEPAQRNPLEHQSPYCLEPDDQSNVSEPQVEPLDGSCSSASAAASPTMSPLTETGAGIILASIKERLGLGRCEDGAQKAPRRIQPRKRRHIEHAPEVEQFPTMETEGSATYVADGPALYSEHRGEGKL